MNLGPFTFDQPLVLSPMAGVTDKPFRRLCRDLGADLAVSEMVKASRGSAGVLSTDQRADTEGEQRPHNVQIIGNNPVQMAQAAARCVEQGADIVDINMGCPAKKFARKPAGSALMGEPKRVSEILAAVVAAVEVPVTLKIRTGLDAKQRNALEIGHIAEAEGIAALAVHGRTRAQKFSGEADHSIVAKLVQALSIPVLANGDIDSPQAAAKVLEQTGCAGMLIGRGARRNPWVFHEIRHFLQTGKIAKPISLGEMFQSLNNYLDDIYHYYGEQKGVQNAGLRLGWCVSGKPGAQAFRRSLLETHTPDQQRALLREFCLGSDEGMATAGKG
ncbi:MAG: tRNA dihydrouridine synthase DusB [bacterium]